MKIIFLLILTVTTVFSKLNVAVAYPYIEQLTKEIAKERVNVIPLSRGDWDPHFVVPKPSLVAGLRNADLLIVNGASLEIGWMPPLVNNANNAKIQPNAKGYLDLSAYIQLQDIPKRVNRSMGHVHAEGNPHFILDPHNIIKLAEVIMLKLSLLDATNKDFYQNNFKIFKLHWQKKLKLYERKMQKCQGMMVVQYHELFNYFLKRYKYKSYGNLEPLPGIAPSSKHTIGMINIIKKNKLKLILQDVYHEKKTAKFIAAKTDANVVVLPHDMGADGSESLEEFYNNIAKKICR